MSTPTWTGSLAQTFEALSEGVAARAPRILAALVIILAGWLIARLLRTWTRRGLTRLGRLLGRSFDHGLEEKGVDALASRTVGTIVFWTVFLVFLAASGEMLGLEIITTGLSRLARYLPSILGALLVVISGLVLGNLTRAALSRAAESADHGFGPGLGEAARLAILSVSTIIALDQVGIDSALLIISVNVLIASVIGGLALAFALGSRGAVSNVLAVHHLRQTFHVGQRIRIEDIEGVIVEFKKTGVVLALAEGRIHIPAAELCEKRSWLLEDVDSPGAAAE